MTILEKIKADIETLPSEDYSLLRKWFLERDWERWDVLLLQDIKSGKLDFLLDEANAGKSQNTLKEI